MTLNKLNRFVKYLKIIVNANNLKKEFTNLTSVKQAEKVALKSLQPAPVVGFTEAKKSSTSIETSLRTYQTYTAT